MHANLAGGTDWTDYSAMLAEIPAAYDAIGHPSWCVQNVLTPTTYALKGEQTHPVKLSVSQNYASSCFGLVHKAHHHGGMR
jgi:hypothetical protein